MRIGILGGTFDPVHYAHLFIAVEAANRLNLQQVLIVPNRVPPHKINGDCTPAEQRAEMVGLAIAGNPLFALGRLELDRDGPSYTIDTLRQLKQGNPNADLVFIAGLDSILDLPGWHLFRELPAECRFAAVTRPGFDTASGLAALPEECRAVVDLLQSPELGISSTMIRERVREGLPIDYLTPQSVVEYINGKGLYKVESRK